MNISAKELSGLHVDKKIQLGTTYATITKVESDAQTVNIRAVVETGSLAPEMFFLSIPAASTITIQDDEPIVSPIQRRFGGRIAMSHPVIRSQNIDFNYVSRVELIRNGKREVVSYGASEVKAYLQDDGRTLKLHYNKEGQ